MKLSTQLARYIAEYILEEAERKNYEDIDTDNIVFEAIQAYQGGAR